MIIRVMGYDEYVKDSESVILTGEKRAISIEEITDLARMHIMNELYLGRREEVAFDFSCLGSDGKEIVFFNFVAIPEAESDTYTVYYKGKN